jgi:hypothetical protein
MKRLFLLSILLFGFSVLAQSGDNKNSFFETAKKMVGPYKLTNGSNTACSEGNLSFVKGDFNQGIHLGHHIFLGPFSETTPEQDKDYCRVDHSFNFFKNKLVQTTKLSKCPPELKDEAGLATKVLTFHGNKITYEIKETHFKCNYILKKRAK